MKRTLFALGLASGLALPLCAGETLRLHIVPEQEVILSGKKQEVVVKIDLTAADARRKARRTPLNLAVVLDRSGSMSGAKIEKARQAAMELVDRLSAEDILSVVTYSDAVDVLLPAQTVEDKDRLKSRIARIAPGGSTALHAGVTAGAEQLEKYFSSRRINRVILLSDGLANVGPSSPQELRRLGRRLSEQGIAVTTIGVGDDYNEDLMAGLAEASDANYYYVRDTEKLPEIFAKELGELLTVAAREVRIEIVCPDAVKPIGFIGRPEQFEGRKAVVKLNQFSGGQNRYVFLRCETEGEKAAAEIARVKVSYVDELDGGKECSTDGTARIRFTDDRKAAESSVRNEVASQRMLLLSAVAKDEAMAHADAGSYEQAAGKLQSQAAALTQQIQSAPAALRPALEKEAGNLRFQGELIQNGRYDRSTRKTMQSESFLQRNSK